MHIKNEIEQTGFKPEHKFSFSTCTFMLAICFARYINLHKRFLCKTKYLLLSVHRSLYSNSPTEYSDRTASQEDLAV